MTNSQSRGISLKSSLIFIWDSHAYVFISDLSYTTEKLWHKIMHDKISVQLDLYIRLAMNKSRISNLSYIYM